jgi:ABC-type uncharacterized transport system ATPase subunit
MSSNDQAAPSPVLELQGITKTFGPVVANENVNFDLYPGEIHALVGENGAGKTTLMRILFGMYRPNAGSIRLGGREVELKKPMDAIEHGIGMVHQHFMLVPSFSVLENITLGAEPGTGGLFDRGQAEEAARGPMERLGLALDPNTVTGSLNVATQQKLEITKVLYRGAKIIILDEPTAVLTPQETEELFVLLKKLAADGSSIIFISHKLREVFAVADRITVLRNGRTVSTAPAQDLDAAAVVAAMTGRSDVNLGRITRSAPEDDVVLSISGLSTGKFAHDAALDSIGFQVRAGEVVGIAGVEGNGQSALAETLIGTAVPLTGKIELAGTELSNLAVSARRDLGLSYVSEDRHREGIPINGSVLEGLAAGRLRRHKGWNGLAKAFPRALQTWGTDMIGKYAIRTSGRNAKCHTLSGGNQQKIVMARELEEQPKCIVLAQPTRGVDLGAIEFLYDRIAEATARGCAVVLISADLDEILRLSDRVLVMYGGRIVAEETATETSREELGMHMTGAKALGAAA